MITKSFFASALCLILLFGACQPPLRIDSFRVSPRNACPTAIAEAAWMTTGSSTRLSVAPLGDETLSPSGFGGIGLGLDNPGDYVFTLVATRDSSTVSDRRTVTVKNSDTLNRSGQVTCSDATPQFLTFTISNDEYSDPSRGTFFKVDRITNRSSQSITVSHLSMTREIGPGASSTAADFGSVQLTGEWTISTPLPPNPCRGGTTGGGTPPMLPRIEISIDAVCGR